MITNLEANVSCGICGEAHTSDYCDFIKLCQHIKDNPVLSRARISLPKQLKIETMSDSSNTVIARDVIEEGTKFGPFEAKKLFTIDPFINFPLKIFESDDYFKEYYLDNSSEEECNWMYFVQPAQSLEEQNLMCYEEKSHIFYISLRTINVGEHLKVWYSPFYAKLMKKDALTNVEIENTSVKNEICLNINELVTQQQKLRDRKLWVCKFCGKQDNDVVSFSIHIKEHYSMQLRKICEFCNEAFRTRLSLKKHLMFNHLNDTYANHITLDKPPPIKNPSTEIENLPGGPLLSVTDSLDNTNILLEHMPLGNDDTMLENDLSVDNLLDESENFLFNIENTKESFVCDICLKNFSKLKLLIVHLTLHTAKYTCNQCATVYTRKENFDAHRCNNKEMLRCDQCDKKFLLKKYLTRHVNTIHVKKFVCNKECKRVFASAKTLEEHKCTNDKNTYACHLCEKEFYKSRNLKRHLNMHNSHTISDKLMTNFLCEICSKLFKSRKILNQHLRTHKEKQFACRVCNKEFGRKSNFIEHMQIHRETSPFVCKVCNEKFSLKRYLVTHMLSHNEEFKYKCKECPQQFRQQANLLTHFNRMHLKKCVQCDEEFDTHEKFKQHSLIHVQKCYECPICKIFMKLKSSLVRHLKRKHGITDLDLKQTEKSTANNNNNNNNSDNQLEDIDGLLNDGTTDLQFMMDNIADKLQSNLDIDFNIDSSVKDNEICLSMPELNQNVTLSENAYLFENGTIIEPVSQGNVVLYILDKDQMKNS